MLPILPQDKANHAVYGAAIACAGLLAHSLTAAAIFVCLAAVGKEVIDWVSKQGTPDPMDALVTIAGGGLVLAPWALP